MSPDLEQSLRERYPKLLQRFVAPAPTDSAFGGIRCEDGWWDLIDALLETLNAHERPQDAPPLEVVQIKAKFGHCAFTWQAGTR